MDEVIYNFAPTPGGIISFTELRNSFNTTKSGLTTKQPIATDSPAFSLAPFPSPTVKPSAQPVEKNDTSLRNSNLASGSRAAQRFHFVATVVAFIMTVANVF